MISLTLYGLVALGGALGAVARYSVGLLLRTPPDGFPWATFSVNVLGSFFMGLVFAWVAARSEATRLFLVVGVLGGFTTFSAFSFDLFNLLERREFWQAAAYAGGTVLAAFAALLLGYALGRLS